MRQRNSKFEWQDAFAQAGYRGATYAVGRAVADRWNGDNNHPITPVDYLCRVTGYGKSSVEKALRRLRQDGWLAQVTRGGRRGDQTWASRYRCTVPNPYSESPNPYSGASQPVTEYGPIDLSLRPVGIDLPQTTGRSNNRQHCPHMKVECEHSCEFNEPCIRSLQQDGLVEYAASLIAEKKAVLSQNGDADE